ncbi:fasciclin-2-like [Uloborus diversus]|uniref:fasciclin-2-like n=1 Tax=Uloborus diversus TaxID=327109 RepID=UPI00240989C8|nr:fasciclin-2-like [Uloborus diversus]
MMLFLLAALLFGSNKALSENSESDPGAVTPEIIKVEADDVKNNSIFFKIHTIGKVDMIFVKYRDVRSFFEVKLHWKFEGSGPYEVKNLMASSEYDFRFALNVPGHWSRPYIFTTLPEKPVFIVGGLSDGSLKVEWSLRTDDNSRKTIDKHELSYYSVINQGHTWQKKDCAIVVEIPSCSESRFTITSLEKGSYYEIRLRAHTASGYGEPYYLKVHP